MKPKTNSAMKALMNRPGFWYSVNDVVEALKRHPVLWDSDHKHFTYRDVRFEAWEQIARQLCTSFETANASEQKLVVKTMASRWQNLKKSYLGILKQSRGEVTIASYACENKPRLRKTAKQRREQANTIIRRKRRSPKNIEESTVASLVSVEDHCASSTVQLDPDRAFFIAAIKPHMELMSADIKLEFQFKLIETLRSFRPYLK
ncbi:uncharacterized protein LOC108602423 [Drosophila busckii]|uniref:uncharacterized protein LOC108602423 n=1 Tax=Drosophila busckii TaxID=30019 RepID=UPI00083F085B|nr:uncharacterized protein LOC108602423 [Drosophila busckii]